MGRCLGIRMDRKALEDFADVLQLGKVWCTAFANNDGLLVAEQGQLGRRDERLTYGITAAELR